MDLNQRHDEPELMDDFTIGGDLMDKTLLEIERINQLLGGNQVTISGFKKLINDNYLRNTQITVADLGCGGGGLLKLMNNTSRQLGVFVRYIGIDANDYIIEFCKKRFRKQLNMEFEVADINSEEFRKMKYDIITATLFFHHFTSDQLVDIFKSMKKQVRFGIVVNDLHRHWFAYHSIKWLTRIFSSSSMVKYDAPLSVQRAFKKRNFWTFYRGRN